MKAAAVIATGAISLAGCSTNKQIYTADGQQGQLISCTPAWTGGIVGQIADSSTSWGTCYEKAGELCGPAGYDILEKTGEAGVYGQGGGNGGFVSTKNNRSMIVKCKGQGPAQAQAKAH
jgi:hypothetical protein